MYSLNRNLDAADRWQSYKQLELISDSKSVPDSTVLAGLGVGFLWRSLLALLVDELVDEQRVDYLERCWAVDQPQADAPPRSPLKQFLMLIE